MPDVRVQWTEGQTMEASGTYVPWETDYSVSGNPEDGYLSVDYSFYASDRLCQFVFWMKMVW